MPDVLLEYSMLLTPLLILPLTGLWFGGTAQKTMLKENWRTSD
jgi:hypothetical protein